MGTSGPIAVGKLVASMGATYKGQITLNDVRPEVVVGAVVVVVMVVVMETVMVMQAGRIGWLRIHL